MLKYRISIIEIYFSFQKQCINCHTFPLSSHNPSLTGPPPPPSSNTLSTLWVDASAALCQRLSSSSCAPQWDTNTTAGSRVGSLLGFGRVFQEGPHVQQSPLYSLGKLGSVCLLTAVEGRDGDVDVLIHGIVTHSIAIWHHWTKAHHAVCLGANLDTRAGERWGQILRQTNLTADNHLLSNNKLFVFLNANLPGWCRD